MARRGLEKILRRAPNFAATIGVGDQQCVFFFSSRRRHTRLQGDWSSDVCSSDLKCAPTAALHPAANPPARTSPPELTALQQALWRALEPEAKHVDALVGAVATSGAGDRKSVGEGKRVDLGGRRII